MPSPSPSPLPCPPSTYHCRCLLWMNLEGSQGLPFPISELHCSFGCGVSLYMACLSGQMRRVSLQHPGLDSLVLSEDPAQLHQGDVEKPATPMEVHCYIYLVTQRQAFYPSIPGGRSRPSKRWEPEDTQVQGQGQSKPLAVMTQSCSGRKSCLDSSKSFLCNSSQFPGQCDVLSSRTHGWQLS